MDSLFFVLGVGLVLGFQHAFEADHMVAVTNLLTRHKNILRAAATGAFWGVGHTTTLFVAGIFVLLLKIQIPEKVSMRLEFGVGIMLVVLGFITLKEAFSKHTHAHAHSDTNHTHPHTHAHHRHSYMVGLVHGLAGSGALMILVLSTIKSLLFGIYYILAFGAGSIIGMTVVSFVIGIPYLASIKKFSQTENYLKVLAGILSIGLGIMIMYTIGIAEGLSH